MCEVCKKSFTSSSNLKQHRLVHKKETILKTGENLTKFRCFINDCSKHYESLEALKKHLQKTHKDNLVVLKQNFKDKNFTQIYLILKTISEDNQGKDLQIPFINFDKFSINNKCHNQDSLAKKSCQCSHKSAFKPVDSCMQSTINSNNSNNNSINISNNQNMLLNNINSNCGIISNTQNNLNINVTNYLQGDALLNYWYLNNINNHVNNYFDNTIATIRNDVKTNIINNNKKEIIVNFTPNKVIADDDNVEEKEGINVKIGGDKSNLITSKFSTGNNLVNNTVENQINSHENDTLGKII